MIMSKKLKTLQIEIELTIDESFRLSDLEARGPLSPEDLERFILVGNLQAKLYTQLARERMHEIQKQGK